MTNRTPHAPNEAQGNSRSPSFNMCNGKRSSRHCLVGIAALLACTVLLATAQQSSGKPPAQVAATPVNTTELKLAISDLIDTFGARYPQGGGFLKRLDELETTLREVEAGSADSNAPQAAQARAALLALRREALLANPLLSFDRLLLVKRSERSPRLGLTANWQGNCSLPRSGFDDEITILSSMRGDGKLSPVYKPEGGKFVGDVDLHFDGRRLLFSSIGTHDRWQVFEINIDGTALRQVTRGEEKDIDNYDACYLPSGNVIYT